MRILHVTRDFPPRSAGGISTAVGGLVAATVEAGAACSVISFDDWRPRLNAGAAPAPTFEHDDATGAAIARLSSPGQLPGARMFAIEQRPDIIHVHHGMLWRFAATVREAVGAPAVLTPHVAQAVQNQLRELAEDTASLRAQREAALAADAVLAPSEAAASALADDVPGIAPPTVVRLGVADSETARAAASANRPAGAPLLYAGRLADINGTGELFEVLAAVLAQRPGVQAIIAGGLPYNEKAEQRWHRQWAEIASNETRDRVVFTGWLPPAQVGNLMAGAAALIAPSWFETFGLTLAEAMLYGLPIASTSAGAIPELLEHDRTALLCRPRDPEAMTANVLALLDAPQRAAELGQAAASRAREKHTWNRVIDGWLRAYESAVAGA